MYIYGYSLLVELKFQQVEPTHNLSLNPLHLAEGLDHLINQLVF